MSEGKKALAWLSPRENRFHRGNGVGRVEDDMDYALVLV